jgi:hypothetical protein
MTVKELAKELRGSWVVVFQLACWVAVVAGQFIPETPLLSLNGDPGIALKLFGQFMGAILVGILIVLCLRKNKRRHLSIWIRGAVIAATLTLVTFFLSHYFIRQWTCVYAGESVLIGQELNRDATAYKTQFALTPSCQQLLADYGGDNSAVWDLQEIRVRHSILSGLLFVVWLACFASVVTLAQAIRVAQSRS